IDVVPGVGTQPVIRTGERARRAELDGRAQNVMSVPQDSLAVIVNRRVVWVVTRFVILTLGNVRAEKDGSEQLVKRLVESHGEKPSLPSRGKDVDIPANGKCVPSVTTTTVCLASPPLRPVSRVAHGVVTRVTDRLDTVHVGRDGNRHIVIRLVCLVSLATRVFHRAQTALVLGSVANRRVNVKLAVLRVGLVQLVPNHVGLIHSALVERGEGGRLCGAGRWSEEGQRRLRLTVVRGFGGYTAPSLARRPEDSSATSTPADPRPWLRRLPAPSLARRPEDRSATWTPGTVPGRNTGAIVGAVLGAGVFIGICVLLGAFLIIRSRRSRTPSQSQEFSGNMTSRVQEKETAVDFSGDSDRQSEGPAREQDDGSDNYDKLASYENSDDIKPYTSLQTNQPSTHGPHTRKTTDNRYNLREPFTLCHKDAYCLHTMYTGLVRCKPDTVGNPRYMTNTIVLVDQTPVFTFPSNKDNIQSRTVITNNLPLRGDIIRFTKTSAYVGLCELQVEGCVSGSYGAQCQETCSQPVGCQPCDSITGNCTCRTGWSPPQCQ
ncbi:hypothetical protein BaRGS_00019022, partial [Batillaria attramentaria]